MNINFIITLTEQEKEIMVKQCVKEFMQADKVIESIRSRNKNIYDETHNGDWGTKMSGQCEMSKGYMTINQKRLRMLAICDIAIALNLSIKDKIISRDFYGVNVDRIGEKFIKFYNMTNGPCSGRLQNKDKPYYRKLAIYMMFRAGVITKDTRDRMLQLLKTKTPIQLQKRTQRKVNKLQEAYVEFNRKINAIVSRDEAKEIAKECGLHRYMVKKYGIEAITSACCGTLSNDEPCGI